MTDKRKWQTKTLLAIIRSRCEWGVNVNLWMGYCKQISMDAWWWLTFNNMGYKNWLSNILPSRFKIYSLKAKNIHTVFQLLLVMPLHNSRKGYHFCRLECGWRHLTARPTRSCTWRWSRPTARGWSGCSCRAVPPRNRPRRDQLHGTDESVHRTNGHLDCVYSKALNILCNPRGV